MLLKQGIFGTFHGNYTQESNLDPSSNRINMEHLPIWGLHSNYIQESNLDPSFNKINMEHLPI